MHVDAGVEVPFVSLDSLTDELGSPSGVVMKIDVEGTEAAIFDHGSKFLERHRPAILCEVLAGQARPEVLDRVLEPLGYRRYLVTGSSLRGVAAIRPHPTYRDWFLVPDRDVPRVDGLGIPVAG